MATYNAPRSTHQTLTANTVDTVTITVHPADLFEEQAYLNVEVVNRDSSNPLYFTADGVTVPTVGGNSCFVVPPGGALRVENRTKPVQAVPVQLIAAAAVAYSVTGV